MSASKIQRKSGLKSWGTENMTQAIKALRNKEMGYLQLQKIKLASFYTIRLRSLKLGTFSCHPVNIGA